ncbi:DUF4232 domain-containing protein [Mycobacterium asiaticum]|uniref:DUF4232 domain-containing protein n=1 Tax=Mycobacterium asiaticum TaxID=1790 RepID=UPI0009C193B8|nr:DUF4232 domain-containing protein [Mycobacterium asiaticum]
MKRLRIPALLVASTFAAAASCPVVGHADDSAPPCQSGQVVVGASRTQAAATHRAVLLTFELASYAPPCTVTGYPGVDSGIGGPQLQAQRTLRGYLGGLPTSVGEPPTITLAMASPAYAVVESVAVDGTGGPCPSYSSLRVTPPDNTDTQDVPVTIDGCALQVHPIGSGL